LQYRRVKFDLVFCFKLLHGLIDVNTNDFVVLSHNNNLRDNQYKLVKPITTSARDANFFSNRIVSIWNSLPNIVVNADTVCTRSINGGGGLMPRRPILMEKDDTSQARCHAEDARPATVQDTASSELTGDDASAAEARPSASSQNIWSSITSVARVNGPS
jgi:hypothetical protein